MLLVPFLTVMAAFYKWYCRTGCVFGWWWRSNYGGVFLPESMMVAFLTVSMEAPLTN